MRDVATGLLIFAFIMLGGVATVVALVFALLVPFAML